jgi:hypothetical protein
MPAKAVIDHIRALLSTGHVEHAVETALCSALARGKVALIGRRSPGDSAATGEAPRRLLEAVQAAGEELDRLALAVAERPTPEG